MRSRDEVLHETQDDPGMPLRRRTRATNAPSPSRTRPGPIIATAVIALAIGAAGGWYAGHRDHTATVQAASTATTAPGIQAGSDPAGGAEKRVGLGQGVPMRGPGGENITAILVGITDPATGNVSHPDAGNRYFSARIRLENHAATSWNGNGAPTIGAHVVDTRGQSYGPVIASTNAGPMYTAHVIIEPGQSQVGVITFSVPADAAIRTVQIVLDNGAGPTAEWQIR